MPIKRRRTCGYCKTQHILAPYKFKKWTGFCNKGCKRKRNRNNKSWLSKECDKEISKLVREKGYCEASDVSVCGGVLQDAHIIGRRNKTLRWDMMNHLCLCYRHHMFFAHRDPVEFILWYQKKYPEKYAYLLEARKLLSKRTTEDYKKLLKAIKEKDIKKTFVLKNIDN